MVEEDATIILDDEIYQGKYQGVTRIYETMDFFFFQSFFDTLSQKFFPPLLSNLTYFDFPHVYHTFDKLDELIGDDFKLNATLWNIKVAHASIDPEPPILQILNGYTVFGFQNLTFNLTSDYKYMSHPPVFADIGDLSILFSNTTVSTNITTYLHRNPKGDLMEFTLSNMTANSIAEPFCAIDGLSDLSDLTQNLANNVAAVVRNRFNSFINGGEKYGVNTKI